MPAYQMLRAISQEYESQNYEELQEQLENEINACTEVESSYRNKVKKFMRQVLVWHISEIDYSMRMEYEVFLKSEVKPVSISMYLKGFDRIKQHSIREQMRTLAGRAANRLEYRNQILFLPYHPDQELAMLFDKAGKKKDLVWDFSRQASENMKKQVYTILHYIIRQYDKVKVRHGHIQALQRFYDFCVEDQVEDIEYLELEQVEAFKSTLYEASEPRKISCIIDISRKALFMEAAEIHWDANVWYMERFHFEKGRVNPANPVGSFSYLEVKDKRNRKLLQMYCKYGLGITNLSIGNLRGEFIIVRKFLTELEEKTSDSVCEITADIMDWYFKRMDGREIQAETYNKQVMAILHFFDYLRVKEKITKLPFCEQYYLKKTIAKHHDRSVESSASEEIMEKLYLFPEHLRLMYLHLWGIGLRASEVCTLKGDAYYVQGRDAWIQVYQIKMKTYKRIPIPASLYKLMKVYKHKHDIQPEDYIFQNSKGGPFQYGTFRNQMIKHCESNGIQNGDYMFQSHDYRHTIAGEFYNNGVSIQGIRDYLGHAYEEMTLQYIDYMPRKINKKSEELFKRPGNSLATCLKKR